MGLMSKFNLQSPFSDIETKGLKYKSLKELFDHYGVDHTYKVRGLFVNPKGKFGAEPVGILEDCLVNLPRHTLEAVQEMLDTDEIIQAIKDDKVGFSIYKYENSYSLDKSTGELKDFYGVKWLDL